LPAILPMKMSWLNRDGYQNSEPKVRHRPRKGCFRGRAGSSVRLSAERESGECAPVAETAEVFPPNQVAGLGIFLAAPTGGARRIGLTHVFAAHPSKEEEFTGTVRGVSAADMEKAKAGLPYGIPVPGRKGMVTSPYTPDEGKYVDVTDFASGSIVKDPYTGKFFLVP